MGLCTITDVYSEFGKTNCDKWADLDNDNNQTAIKNRILAKIETCTEKFYNRIRRGPHAIPFEEDGVPLSVVQVVAKLVGVDLYQGRGITDYTPAGPDQPTSSPVAVHAKDADLWIRNYLANRIHLDLPLISTQHPVTINDDDDDESDDCEVVYW